MGMGSSWSPCSRQLQWGPACPCPLHSRKLRHMVGGCWSVCSCPPLHSQAPPAPARHPLHFDIFQVTLDFIHCCHKLEANTVALIHCEYLCGQSRGERGWAGRRVSLDKGTGVTLTVSTVCATCTGSSPSRASTVTWYCPFSEPSRLLATLQGQGRQRPHRTFLGGHHDLPNSTLPPNPGQDPGWLCPLANLRWPCPHLCLAAGRSRAAFLHPSPHPWPHWMLPT